MAKIEKVWARQVLDSRGNPTVEAVVTVDGIESAAIAPSGASTGMWEALELRDGGKAYGGKAVMKAVDNVRGPVAEAIVGMDPCDQKAVDGAMIAADGTKDMSSFGANGTTAVSFAVARAAARTCGKELFEYEAAGKDVTLPVPMFNIINGGKHAGGKLKVQECMIIPAGADSFSHCLQMAAETYQALKGILKDRYGASAVNVGDEGGFAPPVDTLAEALSTIVDAVSAAGYAPGKDIYLGIDAASSEFFDKKDGLYEVDGLRLDPAKLEDHYEDILDRFPLVSIEDPFHENDYETTADFTKRAGDKIQIVGDDLFVTNPERLQKGFDMGATNALLLKVNQIGTLTEARRAREMCAEKDYNVVVSHRSGESEDTTIADLSVGWATGQIKTGAPCRGERTAKYNRLLRIEEMLGDRAVFPGRKALGL